MVFFIQNAEWSFVFGPKARLVKTNVLYNAVSVSRYFSHPGTFILVVAKREMVARCCVQDTNEQNLL